MALTTYGKNRALKAATEKMLFLGLFTGKPFAVTAETVVGKKVFKMTGSKAKAFETGHLVMPKKVTAGVTGDLVAGRPLYVVNAGTEEFELALEEGGPGIEVLGVNVKTETEFVPLTEATYQGGHERVATSWAGSAKEAEIADTAKEEIFLAASQTVTYAGWWELKTGGLNSTCFAVAELEHEETFTGEGIYKVTSDTLNALTLLSNT